MFAAQSAASPCVARWRALGSEEWGLGRYSSSRKNILAQLAVRGVLWPRVKNDMMKCGVFLKVVPGAVANH
jgi:hypothetical protein